MTDTMRVVMPALNEGDALGVALAGRPAHVPVTVVDNGSTDDTAAIAGSLGADVVVEPRRGFGAACWAGALAATDADVIVFVDADGTFAWPDIVQVGRHVRDGHADLALSWRAPSLRAPGALPRHVAAANRVLGWLCGHAVGRPLHDLGPLRAIRRDVLLDLGIEDRTYGWPLEMVLRAGHRGLRVEELPTRYLVRTGTSKVTGRPWPTFLTFLRMLQVVARVGVRRPRTPVGPRV